MWYGALGKDGPLQNECAAAQWCNDNLQGITLQALQDPCLPCLCSANRVYIRVAETARRFPKGE